MTQVANSIPETRLKMDIDPCVPFPRPLPFSANDGRHGSVDCMPASWRNRAVEQDIQTFSNPVRPGAHPGHPMPIKHLRTQIVARVIHGMT